MLWEQTTPIFLPKYCHTFTGGRKSPALQGETFNLQPKTGGVPEQTNLPHPWTLAETGGFPATQHCSSLHKRGCASFLGCRQGGRWSLSSVNSLTTRIRSSLHSYCSLQEAGSSGSCRWHLHPRDGVKSRLEHSSALERYQRSLDTSEPYFCHSVVQHPTGITHLQLFNRRGAAPVLLSWLLLHRHSELLPCKFKLSVTHFQVQLESSSPFSSLHYYQRFLHPFIHRRGRNTCYCSFYSPHHLKVSPPHGLSKEIAVLPLLNSSLAHRGLAGSVGGEQSRSNLASPILTVPLVIVNSSISLLVIPSIPLTDVVLKVAAGKCSGYRDGDRSKANTGKEEEEKEEEGVEEQVFELSWAGWCSFQKEGSNSRKWHLLKAFLKSVGGQLCWF